MTTPNTQQLAELITRKHECVVQLRDVVARQANLIAQGDMPQLLKLLSAKQHLINALQTIEKGLVPFRNDDPEQRQWASPEARARCAQQAAASRKLLDEVVQNEKTNEEQLAKRRDEIAGRLNTVHTAHQARGAYHEGKRTNSGMLDLTSEG